MTVVNPNSISGITSITMPSGGNNVLTIHTNNGVERFRIDSSGNVKVGSAATISPDGDVFFTGVCTATTLSGAASGLTGALPAISAANLTNVPAANVVGVHTSLTVTNATTTGTAVVGGGVTISESGIEASGIGITCANINGTQIGGRRNLVFNGSMKVAQRGTSYTGTNAYHTVDRFRTFYGTQDENQTYTQGTLSSSDSPYTEGQRHYFRVQNGNQTSGAQAGSYVIIQNRIEAQDVANSGWNYTSANSFITLQFWLRASVSQDYMITVESNDGTNKAYVFLVSLTANTWTKVIRTLPGHADLTFNNDTGIGLKLGWYPYIGTSYSGASTTLNDWVTMSNPYRRTMTTTWFTTNDSTFDITGVQLEVGSQATPFEHRSFGEELALCQRYYYRHAEGADHVPICMGTAYSSSIHFGIVHFPCKMRANPTVDAPSVSNYYREVANGTTSLADAVQSEDANSTCCGIRFTGGSSITQGSSIYFRLGDASAYIAFSAEL